MKRKANRKSRILIVIPLDADGCALRRRAHHDVIASNLYIFKHISLLIQEHGKDYIPGGVVTIFSNRQFPGLDEGNGQLHGTGSFFPAVKKIATHAKEKSEIPFVLETVVLADIMWNKPHGHTFETYFSMNPFKKIAPDNAIEVMDETKFSIVYLQTHKLSDQNGDMEKILYGPLDDRTDIFDKLIAFFQIRGKRATDLIPNNVEIQFHIYNGKGMPWRYGPVIVGTGIVDRNYAESIGFLLRDAENFEGSYDLASRLTEDEGFLAAFERKRSNFLNSTNNHLPQQQPSTYQWAVNNVTNFFKNTFSPNVINNDAQVINAFKTVVNIAANNYLAQFKGNGFPSLTFQVYPRHGSSGYLRAIELKVIFHISFTEDEKSSFRNKSFFLWSHQERQLSLYSEIINPQGPNLTTEECHQKIISFFMNSDADGKSSGYDKGSLRFFLFEEIINNEPISKILFSQKIISEIGKAKNNTEVSSLFTKVTTHRIGIISKEALIQLASDMNDVYQFPESPPGNNAISQRFFKS